MIKIKIPEPIQFVHPLTGQPVEEVDPSWTPVPGEVPPRRVRPPTSFYEWLVEYVLNDKQFNTGVKGWLMASKIEAATKKANGHAEWDDEWHDTIMKVLENPGLPGFGLNANFARQFLPFCMVIKDAK